MYSSVLFCSLPFVMTSYEVIVEIIKADIRDHLAISKWHKVVAFRLLQEQIAHSSFQSFVMMAE